MGADVEDNIPSEEQPDREQSQCASLEGWELTEEQRRFIESVRDVLPFIFGLSLIMPDEHLFDLFIYFSNLC